MKVLLYLNEEELKPIGGPKGYVYNLKCGLKKVGCNEVYYLNQGNSVESVNPNFSTIKMLLKKVFKFMPPFIRNIKQRYTDTKNFSCVNCLPENVNDFDYIHFHSCLSLYKERNNLVNYTGKIILTSHSPKPWHQEYMDTAYNSLKKTDKAKKRIAKIDEYAFDRADYIIFPCKEAEEPYYNQWKLYSSIYERNKEKYRYILSGVQGCRATISKKDIRKKYNIPENAFVISYVGRHNVVKGYERLLQSGEEILSKCKDIYFLIAGKEEPLRGLKNERWVEIGWTNDPYSIIAASNLFVLPNIETYFDLVFLEVLSLGIPILASFTGGNKYFKKFPDSGIHFFNNQQELVEKVIQLKNTTNLEELGVKNLEIFKQYFNEKVFAENYLKLIDSLEVKK